MKTLSMRVWVSGLALSSLVLCAGCEEDEVSAEVPISREILPPYLLADAEAKPQTPTPLEPAVTTNLLVRAEAEATTAAPAAPAVRAVGNPVPPPDLKISPALAEVVKLFQAGISEEVILAYVTNGTNAYELNSDGIVYLNDLGVSTPVITALIQHDAQPDTQARVAASNAVQPLPPGVALTTPATNIYPPTIDESQPAPPVAPAAPEVPVPATYAPNPAPDSASVSYFYDSLAPYGNWVNVEDYGWCWQPTVAVVNSGWRPYCDSGRWLWSDSGWYWYSDYSWGWAPFHYGRWCNYPRRGWLWVPDTCWGPSWVTWRYNNFYAGWAPLPPRCHYFHGYGLFYHRTWVGAGFDFGFGASFYTFIPLNRFCDRSPHHYYVPSHQVTTIYKQTTVINNYGGNNTTVVNNGVGFQKVARVTRTDIPRLTVKAEPLLAAKGQRPERIEQIGSTPAIVRPELPKNPSLVKGRTAATAPAPRADLTVATRTRADAPPRSDPALATLPAPRTADPSRVAPTAGPPAKGSRSPATPAPESARATTPSPSPSAGNADRVPVFRAAPVKPTVTVPVTPTASVPEATTPSRPASAFKQDGMAGARTGSDVARPAARGERPTAQPSVADTGSTPGAARLNPSRTAPLSPSTAGAPSASLNPTRSPAAPARSGSTEPILVQPFKPGVATPSTPRVGTPGSPAPSAPRPTLTPSAPPVSRSSPSLAEATRPSPSPSFSPAPAARPAPTVTMPSAPVRSAPMSVPIPRPEPTMRSAPSPSVSYSPAPAPSSRPSAPSAPSAPSGGRSSGGGGGGGKNGRSN